MAKLITRFTTRNFNHGLLRALAGSILFALPLLLTIEMWQLVAAQLGYLAYHAIRVDNTPPNISVKIRAVDPVSNGFLVHFEAYNAGGEAAATLMIQAHWTDEGTKDVIEAELDYLPSHSLRGGGIFLSEDKVPADLQLRAVSYVTP